MEEEEDSQCTKCPYTLEEINSKLPLRFRSAESHHYKVKMAASKSPITTFTVGNWKRDSNLKGNLTAKFYYGMKKLVWEFLNGPLKTKMEVCWSDITAIEAVMIPNQSGCLRIELAKPPLFFREIPPQPWKQTKWEPADDFTNGQGQLCRKHEAVFPPGALDKQYEKLLISNGRLAELSRRPFPANESVFPLQQIPQPQLSSWVLPLQHIPKQQFHHSLNSNIIAASASSNGVKGNEINNEPTFVDSSRQNHPHDLDQRLYQYNDPTSVASLSQSPVAVPASTFVVSSTQNHPLVVPDQRLYQHNEPTFVCQSSLNPVAVPASTYVDQSSSQNSSVVTDQHLYEHNDTFVPFIPPPSGCRPKFHHGLIEAQYLVQNGADAGEQALAEATIMEANATCDNFAWSAIELFYMLRQEDHCNEPVEGGNEASSVSPSPPSSHEE